MIFSRTANEINRTDRYELHSIIKNATLYTNKESENVYVKIVKIKDLSYCFGFIDLSVSYDERDKSVQVFFSYDGPTFYRGRIKFETEELALQFLHSFINDSPVFEVGYIEFDDLATLNQCLSESGFLMEQET
jgi:hypothetical protein